MAEATDVASEAVAFQHEDVGHIHKLVGQFFWQGRRTRCCQPDMADVVVAHGHIEQGFVEGGHTAEYGAAVVGHNLPEILNHPFAPKALGRADHHLAARQPCAQAHSNRGEVVKERQA